MTVEVDTAVCVPGSSESRIWLCEETEDFLEYLVDWYSRIACFLCSYLLVLDRTNWRVNLLTALLIPYLALQLPEPIFGILRWICVPNLVVERREFLCEWRRWILLIFHLIPQGSHWYVDCFHCCGDPALLRFPVPTDHPRYSSSLLCYLDVAWLRQWNRSSQHSRLSFLLRSFDPLTHYFTNFQV